jgi:hypothetical protein
VDDSHDPGKENPMKRHEVFEGVWPIALAMLAAAIGVLGTGCNAPGPAFYTIEPTSESSVVYIYRPDGRGANVPIKISLDGREIGVLKNKGYVVESVAPGEHTVTASAGGIERCTVSALPGKSHYVEVQLHAGAMGGLGVVELPELQAMGRLQLTRLSD